MKRCRLHIPEEILVEVLCHLPRKSRCRCKCVSKRWCNLISDPKLIIPKTTKAGLVFQFKPRNSDTSVTIFLRLDNMGGASVDRFIRYNRRGYNMNKKFRICDSCNGFLLLYNRFREDGPLYLVYNPISKFIEQIFPPTPTDHVTLVFDGKHLKVIFLSVTCGGLCFEFDLFSVADKKWSQKTLQPPRGERFYFSPFSTTQSRFFKGAVHWLLTKHLHICHLQDGFCKVIPLPSIDTHMLCEKTCIWVFEGRLHYCQVGVKREDFEGLPFDDEFRSNRHVIDIWVLLTEEYRYVPSSQQCFKWQHKHSGTLLLPTCLCYWLQPVAFNEDFGILYLHFDGSIISYNPQTRKQEVAYESPSKGEKRGSYINPAFPFLYLSD